MSGRRKGTPMYGGKSVQGSHFITKKAKLILRAAAKRTGKSESDIIEYCARSVAPTLTRAEAEKIAGARGDEAGA